MQMLGFVKHFLQTKMHRPQKADSALFEIEIRS